MVPRRSPLYSAVVLAGVSLTSTALTAACADDDNTTKTGSPDASTSSSSGGSSGSSTTDAATTDTGTPADACPPDSEIPTPPCALIK